MSLRNPNATTDYVLLREREDKGKGAPIAGAMTFQLGRLLAADEDVFMVDVLSNPGIDINAILLKHSRSILLKALRGWTGGSVEFKRDSAGRCHPDNLELLRQDDRGELATKIMEQSRLGVSEGN